MLPSLFPTVQTISNDNEVTPSVDLGSIISSMPALPSLKMNSQIDVNLENLLDFSKELAAEQKFYALAREAKTKEPLSKEEKSWRQKGIKLSLRKISARKKMRGKSRVQRGQMTRMILTMIL